MVYGEIDLRMQADFEKLRILRPKEVLYRYASLRKVCDPEERKKKEKWAGAELCQAQDQLGLPSEAKLILEIVYTLGFAGEDL
jgi:hypothetical protein